MYFPLDNRDLIAETVVYKLQLLGSTVEVQPRQVKLYKTENGVIPFAEWLDSLDRRDRVRIDARLAMVRETGNLGDCDPVGSGVFEMKDHYGAGYRIYFGQIGREIVLLLCGGIKKNQNKDIRKAKDYWKNHLARYERK
ncbi:MAG: type II toxin-antitoxin system RelE/ParE family toxin [Thermoleophilia bacterium]